jgi:hypothetical protein
MMEMMSGRKNMYDLMGMMPKGMEKGQSGEGPGIPSIWLTMMPHCLKMMLPRIPKEKRMDFVSEMIPILVEQGCLGMAEEEKKDFMAKVIEKLKANP